jgi:hypothetical protein
MGSTNKKSAAEMKNSHMQYHNPNRVSQLRHDVRIALGAACAERVLPVFESDYAPGEERPRIAVNLAWDVAIGIHVPSTILESARSGASAAVPPVDSATVARKSCLVSVCAIDVISETSTIALRELMGMAISVAELLDDEEEEFNWQSRAIEVAEMHRGPVTRELFDSIKGTPRWFEGFDDEG